MKRDIKAEGAVCLGRFHGHFSDGSGNLTSILS